MLTRASMVLIALSWIAGVVPALVGPDFLLRERFVPALPRVSLPVGSQSDLVSVVPHLYRAFVAAIIAVLVVEPAKYALTRSWRVYMLVVGYQAVLFVDLIRWYAYDWFLYALHFARFVNLNENPVEVKRWGGFGAPWLSLLAMVILLLVIVRIQRSNRTELV